MLILKWSFFPGLNEKQPVNKDPTGEFPSNKNLAQNSTSKACFAPVVFPPVWRTVGWYYVISIFRSIIKNGFFSGKDPPGDVGYFINCDKDHSMSFCSLKWPIEPAPVARTVRNAFIEAEWRDVTCFAINKMEMVFQFCEVQCTLEDPKIC